MFETCRRQEELNENINLKSAFVGEHYIIVSHCAVQKTHFFVITALF